VFVFKKFPLLFAALLLSRAIAASAASPEYVSAEIQSLSARTAAVGLDVDQITEQAQNGNTESMLILGLAHRDGVGATRDLRLAEHWFSRASQNNDRRALFLLADLYFQTDKSKAIAVYRKLASQGDAEAQNNLAAIYLDQENSEKTRRDAVALFESAANDGLAAAQFNLGHLYDTGRIVAQDYPKAFNLFFSAAEQRYAAAQNELGVLYLQGLGVPQDYAQARNWFEQAAAGGNAAALNNLGAIYAQGWGVAPDATIAFGWYTKAARAGSAIAQNNIAVAYLTGRGVERNIPLALQWLAKAADQGSGDARYNFRALCHTMENPPAACGERQISTASFFRRPGAKVLWRGDYVE